MNIRVMFSVWCGVHVSASANKIWRLVLFCVDSASLATSFKKCNVIMACREIDNVYQATCDNEVNMRGD